MALQLPVVVYGNGDLYRELFNAIASSFNDSSYHYFTELSLLIAGTWAILRFSAERNLMVLVRWLGLYYFAFYVMFIPKTTVDIIDRINPGHAYAIDNVPLGLAITANFTSVIGDSLTQLMEKNFSLPDDLHYGKTGMVMASQLVLASTQFEVTDANFNQSLQSFVQQCVFYDVLLNKYTWNDLLNATHIWSFVSGYASPARAFLYYQPGQSQVVVCKEGISRLNQDWNSALQDAASRYGARLFPDANNSKTQLLSYLANSYQFLTNISDNATLLMQQNMMANALQNGILHMGASTSSPAALETYAFVKAQQQKRLTNVTVLDMAAYWLPIMKNVLEATLYGAFVFVFLLLVFPFGLSIFKNYVISLTWLQLWAPLYAILNLFMNYYAKSHSLGALYLESGTGLALSNQAGFAQVNADVASLAGYLSLSVPLLAAGVMKGLMSVFVQAAQYIGGVTQSVASSSAGESITGNFSLGNTQFSNHSSLNTSANHFDTNARVFSGMYTYQMAGGSTLSTTPSGSLIMNNQSAISSLGTSINLAHAIREMASQQADSAYSTALSYAHAYSDSVTSGLRSLYELSGNLSTSESSGTGSSVTVTGSTSASLNHLHQLTERFAHDHGISTTTASRWLGAAYASGKLGTPIAGLVGSGAEGGLKGEKDISHSHENRNLYNAAQDFVRNTGFTESMDIAVRGMQEHQYRVNNEQGQRLVDSISTSFDSANQARQEVMNNYQQSQSYREAASYAEENSATINSNASQAFMNSLVQSDNSPSAIEKTMVNDPGKAQASAEHFVKEQAQQFIQDFHNHGGSSPEDMRTQFEQQNQQIPNARDVSQKNQDNQTDIQAKATSKIANADHVINKQVEKDAHILIAGDEYGVNTGKTILEEDVRKVITEVKDNMKK